MLENTKRLEKLYRILNYEIATSILFAASLFIGILLPIVLFAAIVFIPYMVYILIKEDKKGWIFAFVIFVIVPLILTALIYPLLLFVVLAPFYFYCFVLRVEVKSWLTEMRARNEYFISKMNKENAENNIEDWIVQK